MKKSLIITLISFIFVLAACKKDINVTSITLNNSTIELGVGDTKTLRASVLPKNATNSNVRWSSGNESIALVSQTGIVTGVALGKTFVTATSEDGNFTATCEVTIAKMGISYLTEFGWRLTKATFSPAYEMLSGELIVDLFNGFLESCEIDDILYFKTNNAQILNPGADNKSTNIDLDCVQMPEKTLGNWQLSKDEKSFTSFYLPYFPEDKFTPTIITLTRNRLSISLPIKDEANDVTLTLDYSANIPVYQE